MAAYIKLSPVTCNRVSFSPALSSELFAVVVGASFSAGAIAVAVESAAIEVSRQTDHGLTSDKNGRHKK